MSEPMQLKVPVVRAMSIDSKTNWGMARWEYRLRPLGPVLAEVIITGTLSLTSEAFNTITCPLSRLMSIL